MSNCRERLRSQIRTQNLIFVIMIGCCQSLYGLTANVRIWNLLEDPVQVEYANEHCIYVTDQFARSKQVSQKQMFVSTISSRYFCLGYSSVDFVFRIVKGSKSHRIGAVTALLRSGYTGVGGWSKTRKKLIQRSIDFHLFPAHNQVLSEWSDVNFTIVVFRKTPIK